MSDDGTFPSHPNLAGRITGMLSLTDLFHNREGPRSPVWGSWWVFVDVAFSLEAFRTCPQDNRDLSEQARRCPQEMIQSPVLLV